MQLNHYLLSKLYPAYRAISFARSNRFFSSQPLLRILTYHDIPPRLFENFKNQIQWLKSSWSFITPHQFRLIIEGREKLQQDSILLTFDDGFYSNYDLALKILDPLGIKAIFFVVSDFINAKTHTEARYVISQGIFKGFVPDKMPIHWHNMSWEHVIDLNKRGHCIGAHTASHPVLSSIIDQSVLDYEIIYSADIIQDRLQCDLNYFAFPFGNSRSISQQSLATVKSRFKYAFTSLRGSNEACVSQLLARDTVSPLDPRELIGSFLHGAADLYYAGRLDLLRRYY